jgi:hypothetical protein
MREGCYWCLVVSIRVYILGGSISFGMGGVEITGLLHHEAYLCLSACKVPFAHT